MKIYILFFKYENSKVNMRAIKFYEELEAVYFYSMNIGLSKICKRFTVKFLKEIDEYCLTGCPDFMAGKGKDILTYIGYYISGFGYNLIENIWLYSVEDGRSRSIL